MLKIGAQFPQFDLKAVVSANLQEAFINVTNSTYAKQWKIVFFWPHDFTFVCPTEIAEFGRLHSEFKDRDTEVLGVSTDSEYVHLAWKQHLDDGLRYSR
jgi:alkyl hydroperoxide reductase subunit AhpC